MKVKTLVKKANKHAQISEYYLYHRKFTDYVEDYYSGYNMLLAEWGDYEVDNYTYTGKGNGWVILSIYVNAL